MSAADDRPIVWRFGDGSEDGAAWLANPAELHAYVDFQVPGSTAWHRLTVGTDQWITAQLQGAAWAFFPAMLVVRLGSPEEIRTQVDSALNTGWPLLAREATVLPDDYEPLVW